MSLLLDDDDLPPPQPPPDDPQRDQVLWIVAMSLAGVLVGAVTTSAGATPTVGALPSIASSSWGWQRDSLSELDHLEGETLQVLADGVLYSKTVASGVISGFSPPALRITYGLPIESTLRTLPVIYGSESYGQAATVAVGGVAGGEHGGAAVGRDGGVAARADAQEHGGAGGDELLLERADGVAAEHAAVLAGGVPQLREADRAAVDGAQERALVVAGDRRLGLAGEEAEQLAVAAQVGEGPRGPGRAKAQEPGSRRKTRR